MMSEYQEYKVAKTWDVTEIYTVSAETMEQAIRFVEDGEESNDALVYTVSKSEYEDNFEIGYVG
jgi:hypothetical protein